jgi:hypothetical protein
MAMQNSNIITPREQMEMDYQREMTDKHLKHEIELKAMQLESEKISSKWTVVFKLPLALIKLPVQILIVIPLTVYAVRGIEPPESLTSFIKV